MILAYVYKSLLAKEENDAEVLEILDELDCDVRDAEYDKRRQQLLNRLKEIGELKIYERLTGEGKRQ